MTIHPTAYADQLQAATADARRRMRRAAHLPLLRLTPAAEHPAWMAAIIDRHALALLSGQGRTCPHLGAGPRVALAFAWAPGLMVCGDCRAMATPSPVEEATCDRCRRHCRRIWPGIAQHGPLLIGYGLCDTCHANPGNEVER